MLSSEFRHQTDSELEGDGNTNNISSNRERARAVHRAVHCPVCTFWNFRLDSVSADIVLLNIQIWDIYIYNLLGSTGEKGDVREPQ